MAEMAKSPARSLYSILNYWRAAGLRGLEVPDPTDLPPDPEALRMERHSAREKMEGEVLSCTACGLHASRRRSVLGEGDLGAELMFITDAATPEDEESGKPFSSEAGRLIDLILEKLSLNRSSVYLTQCLKCSPPGRHPEKDEIQFCSSFLRREIEIVSPVAIMTMGSLVTGFLLGLEKPIGLLRGQVHEWLGIPVVPTYHLNYVLKKRSARKDVWEDVLLLMKVYNKVKSGK
ncbi:MAG: uracil-DNA glycosylase [Planctomycetes bacterium]|nr:uracil-DNA glycosylase [Planctomycetota bacterium]